MAAIKRYEMVELTIPAGTGAGSRVPFNTIPQLRNQQNQDIFIKGIKIFLASVYAASQANNAIPGFPATELPKCVLVLYVNGEESIKQIPLAQLNNINDVANPFQFMEDTFEDLSNVDWDKSYVQFNTAAAGAPYVIPFGITYMRFLKKP